MNLGKNTSGQLSSTYFCLSIERNRLYGKLLFSIEHVIWGMLYEEVQTEIERSLQRIKKV